MLTLVLTRVYLFPPLSSLFSSRFTALDFTYLSSNSSFLQLLFLDFGIYYTVHHATDPHSMLAWPVTAGNDFEETPHLEGYALTKALAAVESQRHIPSVTVIEPDNTAVGVVEGEYHQFFFQQL